MKSPRTYILDFINSKKEYPISTFIAAGLFPLFHYFNTHLFIVNSPKHLLFFAALFLILPIVIFYAIYKITKKTALLNSYHKFVLPFINIGMFTVLLVLITIGIKKKLLLLALIISVILAMLLYKSLKKIVVFQYILAVISFLILISKSVEMIAASNEWIEQPDHIESATFKKNPNIYIIQPDGYANFSELNKGYYNFDNSNFEAFLLEENFKLYQDFRSNYVPTVPSNSSIFGMKHHYYKTESGAENETYDFRKIIVQENPVLSIFKANNYTTHLLLQEPYFISYKSTLAYDYCNIKPDDISYFSSAFGMNKPILPDFETLISRNKKSNNFYFIEKIKPWHISNNADYTLGKDQERLDYLDRLSEVNTWLKDAIKRINSHDPDGLIIIVADHGGFVGFDYEGESKTKSLDRDLVYSIFTSALAIKWPNNEVPEFDNQLKTPVNLFRILFSYLSDNASYLKHLQDDKSYLIIEEGAPLGVYEVIDDEGDILFERHSNQ